MRLVPLLSALLAASFADRPMPGFAADVPSRVVEDVSGVIDVADVTDNDTTVRGTLVNRTGETLKEVRLMVSRRFMWKDDAHPGPDNPSWSTVVTLERPIPPHQSVPFTVDTGPLPNRTDGHFKTEANVLSLVAWTNPPPIVPAPPTMRE